MAKYIKKHKPRLSELRSFNFSVDQAEKLANLAKKSDKFPSQVIRDLLDGAKFIENDKYREEVKAAFEKIRKNHAEIEELLKEIEDMSNLEEEKK